MQEKRYCQTPLQHIAMRGCCRAVALVALVALVGCVGDGPRSVTLAQLVAQQADYSGRSVQASGVLRRHDAPLHYWIEDDIYNRVALESTADLARWVGIRIIVRGTFHYAEDKGRWIDADNILADIDAASGT